MFQESLPDHNLIDFFQDSIVGDSSVNHVQVIQSSGLELDRRAEIHLCEANLGV